MIRRMMVAGLLVVLVAGCGKSDDQKKAEEASKKIEEGAKTMQQGADQMAKSAQESSNQMAQGLQQMAQGFQQMAQGGTKAVDYENLKALLPDIDGWTRSDTKGEQVSMPVSYSRGETRYQKDDARIGLEITDSALNQLLLAPISMFMAAGYSERSDDGFKRAAKISGYPGVEEWNVNSKHGEVTIMVNNRFIVSAKGDDVASLDPVRKVVEAVNLSKLAAMK